MSGLYPFLVSIGAAALVSCVCENKNVWAFLAISIGCAAAAIYCLAHGSWPFAIIDAIFAVGAFVRWLNACAPKGAATLTPADHGKA